MARRTRFVVEIDGEEKHCLAYSAAWVAQNYPDATNIRPWSAVKRGLKAHAGTWTLDDVALAEAKEFFNLRLPVDIVMVDGASAVAGRYSFTPFGEAHVVGNRVRGLDTATAAGTTWRHVVQVRRGQSAEAASRALWHELTHAMQAERRVMPRVIAGETPRRVFDSWVRSYEMAKHRTAYWNKPVEVEARAHEAYAEALPLVREV